MQAFGRSPFDPHGHETPWVSNTSLSTRNCGPTTEEGNGCEHIKHRKCEHVSTLYVAGEHCTTPEVA